MCQGDPAIAGSLFFECRFSSAACVQTVNSHQERHSHDSHRAQLLRVDPSNGSIDNAEHNPIVGLAWRDSRLYGVEIFPHDDQWTTDNANLVAFDRLTGARTVLLTGFASLPNGLVVGPDAALYTSNWGISFTGGGDGEVLRIDVAP